MPNTDTPTWPQTARLTLKPECFDRDPIHWSARHSFESSCGYLLEHEHTFQGPEVETPFARYRTSEGTTIFVMAHWLVPVEEKEKKPVDTEKIISTLQDIIEQLKENQ